MANLPPPPTGSLMQWMLTQPEQVRAYLQTIYALSNAEIASGTGKRAAVRLGAANAVLPLPSSSGDAPLAISEGGTGASTAADARASLGILGSTLSSSVTAVSTSGGSPVTFSNGPTVTLTAGTWLCMGTVAAQLSLAPNVLWAVFRNTTDNVDFGAGATYESDNTAERHLLACNAVVTVTANTAVYLRVYSSAGNPIVVGTSTASSIAGQILAVRLTA